MGGNGDGGFTGSDTSASLRNSTSATRPLTTSLPKASAKAITKTTMESTANAMASTSDQFTDLPSGPSHVFALTRPSIATTKKHWEPLLNSTVIPNKIKPGITLDRLIQTVSSSQMSTSKLIAPASLTSRASRSSASAEAVFMFAASVSRASASRACVSAVSASAASEAAVSFPSQISSNQRSSALCKSIGNSSCINAYSLYNPTYLYTEYTSYVQTAGGFDGEWLGWGCAAMFTCDNATMYAHGMMGQQILNAFRYLYSSDGVGICGSIYMDNGCHLTVNACDECGSSMRCNALPTMDQPPEGGVPYYFNNGTTWPPDKAPSSPNRHPNGLNKSK